MSVTEEHLDTLIDAVNRLICEDGLLQRREREDLVRAVAAMGAMKARVLMAGPAVPARATPEEKKARTPDPRFPRAGEPWLEEEEQMLTDALGDVPDDAIGTHLFWLAENLGRTPYSVACKVASWRKLPKEWKNQFRKISDRIRDSRHTVSEYLDVNGPVTAENGWGTRK